MDYATIRDLMEIDADKISKVAIADINYEKVHTVYDIQYHIVGVTKYRYHILKGEI